MSKNISPKHVAEIGVWHPHTSNIYEFIVKNIKTTLVEPDPESIALIKKEFANYSVMLHEAAVCDFDGKVELCKRKSSTFVSTLPQSPAIVNDEVNVEKEEMFSAKAIQFSQIDDGTIDLVSVDTEGSEWFAIKNMVSRPAVISIETHGGLYLNPYLKELRKWMRDHGYKLWYQDKSDSIYVYADKVHLNFKDRLFCGFSILSVKLKYLEKKINQLKKIFKK